MEIEYTAKYFGDWAANNNPIHSSCERSAFVYKNWCHAEKNSLIKEEIQRAKDDFR